MHARNRSPGNGYRSNSMGIGGLSAASRVSPEGTFRGHGLYNSDHGSFNRNFGRGRSKPFQAPQPPSRRSDIFMEAGRLATEYLISKGLLSSDILSNKSQSSSVKNGVVDFRGLKAQGGYSIRLPSEGRASALTRLGSSVPDVISGRRRFPDDNKLGSKNHERGSRRMGSFKNNGSELNQEFERSGIMSDKARSLAEKEYNDGTFSGGWEDQQVNDSIGSGLQKSSPSQSAEKTDIVSPSSQAATKVDTSGDLQSDLEKNQTTDDASLKGSSPVGIDAPIEHEVESIRKSDDPRIIETSTEVLKESGNGKTVLDDTNIQSYEKNSIANKNGCDLLSICKFAKVPTKTRTSLTARGSKVDSVTVTKNEGTHDSRPSEEPEVFVKDVSVDVSSSGSALGSQSQHSNCLHTDIPKASPVEDASELGLAYSIEQGKCSRSVSFHESSLTNEEPAEAQPSFGRSSSMPLALERGEKRALEHSNMWEVSKKPRDVPASTDIQVDDDYVQHSNTQEKELTACDGRSSDVEEGRSVDISLFPKGGSKPCIQYSEKKRPYLGSFKICDLNLVEASDVNENHNSHPSLMFPPIPESEKENIPVDIDLAISNNSKPDTYARCGTDGKMVEVIDLENDSMLEDAAFNNSERKVETVFTGLESFSNHTQNANEIPDTQENYGLMISELLGNDIPNCTTMPPDINPLHNDMGLHNGEGILGDDDSIYMSLGEIPISFLRVWEQPTQEYEKPF